jgi:hypothetical protein
MKKHVDDYDAAEWDVIDAKTGVKITGVQWVDDETGEFGIVLRDTAGDVIVDDNGEWAVFNFISNSIKLVQKKF